MTMGDRVAVMRRGRLQQFAPPQEVYARPANAFVGGFVGSPAMNFLQRILQRANGDISVLLGEQRLALDASILEQRPRLGEYGDAPVIVGIRPEIIQDAALAPDPPPDRLLHGAVELREALGPELLVHFTAPHVQLADTASIADLPRDTSTVGVGADSGAILVGRFGGHSELGKAPRSTLSSIPGTCISSIPKQASASTAPTREKREDGAPARAQLTGRTGARGPKRAPLQVVAALALHP